MSPVKQPLGSARHGVLLSDDGFHVVHRNRSFGLFTVQWALDLLALELIFDGVQVASLGIAPAVHADLDGLGLPTRVREIAIIVFAASHEAIQLNLPEFDRVNLIANTLLDHGLERFRIVEAAR